MSDISKHPDSPGFAAFYAHLEDGHLVMEPYCSCGNPPDEHYHCDKCEKRCHCNDILCADQATLNLVEKYMRTSPKLRNFNAMLGTRSTRATEDQT
jgi:hypothetical protein